LALIERNIASAEQELTESEARRRLMITAPESGAATAVVAQVGQVADPSRPLASIMPSGAKLQAHLYVPSKAVGFVKPGDAVLLRYQAFPYQKFGNHRGIVATVFRTALFGNELTGTGMPPSGGAGAANEPMYRVTVDLASQSVHAYGIQQPLQSGMLLEADLLQDKRRLYEWVLEPLYSLSGKF
jgi:membrane fusion protein